MQHRIHFSNVSELLSSLYYLSWPLVFAMLLAPDWRWVWCYAIVAAPVLPVLLPLASFAFALAMLVAEVS